MTDIHSNEFVVVSAGEDWVRIKPKGSPDSHSFVVPKEQVKSADLDRLKALSGALDLILGDWRW